jgi:hypothetical protein
MRAVGEEVEPGYDEIIQTDLDYPMRNVYQVSRSNGLIAITGGDGTLEELLPALIDYDLPVSILKGSGQAASAWRRSSPSSRRGRRTCSSVTTPLTWHGSSSSDSPNVRA